MAPLSSLCRLPSLPAGLCGLAAPSPPSAAIHCVSAEPRSRCVAIPLVPKASPSHASALRRPFPSSPIPAPVVLPCLIVLCAVCELFLGFGLGAPRAGLCLPRHATFCGMRAHCARKESPGRTDATCVSTECTCNVTLLAPNRLLETICTTIMLLHNRTAAQAPRHHSVTPFMDVINHITQAALLIMPCDRA